MSIATLSGTTMMVRESTDHSSPLAIQRHSAGYATVTRTRRLMEQVALSTPILLGDRVLASLTVRFVASAVPLKSGLERFLAKLRRCAAKISTSFSEQQSESYKLPDGVAATP
ncbi:MAG: hypothetical protein ABJC66_00490 [Gammaproteobacteria bacterium]